MIWENRRVWFYAFKQSLWASFVAVIAFSANVVVRYVVNCGWKWPPASWLQEKSLRNFIVFAVVFIVSVPSIRWQVWKSNQVKDR